MNFYKLFCLRLLSGMTWFFVIFSGIDETKKDSRPEPREAGTPMNRYNTFNPRDLVASYKHVFSPSSFRIGVHHPSLSALIGG